MKELEAIRMVTEIIIRGSEAAEAIVNFCQWLFHDPEEAARVAKSRATGLAAGKAGHDAAKNAGPGRKAPR